MNGAWLDLFDRLGDRSQPAISGWRHILQCLHHFWHPSKAAASFPEMPVVIHCFARLSDLEMLTVDHVKAGALTVFAIGKCCMRLSYHGGLCVGALHMRPVAQTFGDQLLCVFALAMLELRGPKMCKVMRI